MRALLKVRFVTQRKASIAENFMARMTHAARLEETKELAENNNAKYSAGAKSLPWQ